MKAERTPPIGAVILYAVCVLSILLAFVFGMTGQLNFCVVAACNAAALFIAAQVVDFLARSAEANEASRDLLEKILLAQGRAAVAIERPADATDAAASPISLDEVARDESARRDRANRDRANAPCRATNRKIIDEMRRAGITELRITAPHDATLCPTCRAMLNRTFAVESISSVPPPACTCEPASRLTVAAAG